ncbi:HlyD family type I secretion periplasmic adaptor subunit [Ensifer sp. MJa1]|uniref:HlyD family type I secretion periplasmic adaptor subunit n=1 Tax=Ensifer sp. MJa1 TaxID=2919888 RepID=UPI0030097C9D
MQLAKISPLMASRIALKIAGYAGNVGRATGSAPPATLSGRISLTLADPSPMPRLRRVAWTGNLLVGVFVVGLGVWSILAPLSSAAIASGVVEAETNRKTIQHLEGGIIRRIFVQDGDRVTAGQVLIKLDDTKPRSERDNLRGQLWDAKARQARLLAEQNGWDHVTYPPELAEQMADYRVISDILTGQQNIFDARRQVMRSEIAITQEKIKQVLEEVAGLSAQKAALIERNAIARQEFTAISTLTAKGLERKSRVLILAREKADIGGQIGEVGARISRAHQVISESQAYLIKLRSDRLNEVALTLRETENQLAQLRERLLAIDDQLARTEIRAPEEGVIMDLRVHTAGGVIGAGEPLADLVPQASPLVIAARVKPEDISQVHAGLEAQVHLIPYNQRRVPLLKGTVAYVSADHLVDRQTGHTYYAATIRVTDERLPHMTGVHMVPGMPVRAMIETGTSSVALYALRPLLDSFNSAFREN